MTRLALINNELARAMPGLLGGATSRPAVRNWTSGVTSRDVEYVEAAAAGDQAAFAYLFETRVRKISGYVQNIISNTAETEEIVAEVFVSAWRKLGKLKEPERFDAWLFRIAHNFAMDSLRKKKATVPLEGDALLHPDPNPDNSPEGFLEIADRKRIIQNALLQLSDEQREVLTLRFLAEMSHAEVATQLGKSVEAVRALQSRGIKQLRLVNG